MIMKKVGKVTHYYGKIGVVIIQLLDNCAVGDTIKFKGHGKEFEQLVDSMQIDHKPVEKAKKGDIIGMKVSQEVAEGTEVFK